MKFDHDKISKLSSELLNSMRMLGELSSLSLKEFLSDPHKVASAKYHLLIAIEAAIDMCSHVISKNKLRAPEDYADTFRIIGEAGAFSNDFTDRLMDMARFRNRLVHIYWEVDAETLYNILKEDIADFDRFLEDFSRFLTG